MYFLKKSLALTTMLVMAVALGTGCNNKTESKPTTANAKVAIEASALQSDIGSVQLTIDGAPGSPAGTPGFPITTLLTKAAAGNVWTGNVTQIPANATGVNRTFTAAAYSGPNATGTKVYEGSTIATVTAGQTAQVTIILQELNVQPGPSNYAPVITAVTSTAAYLLPGQTGSFGVAAYDPDNATHFNRPQFNGEPLAYLWSASCDNGTLGIGTPTTATTTFTAPNVPSAICTVSVKVSETALANNSSVTTYFTVTVNGNFGNADIFAFPNTSPVVTVRGDLRYNFFTDVGAVGQQGDLFFHAVDADGDNVRFDLSAKCGTGFDAVDGQLVNGTSVAANQFSAVTLTTTNGGPVAPPASKAYDFNPTFGYPAPVQPFTDPSKSCAFKIVVSDLCTGGNCGPAGAQGTKPDGADRGGQTTGFLNATAPAQPKRAPSITRVSVPNQSGGAVAGAQTWDPQKFVIVAPGSVSNIGIEANDIFEAGPLSIAGACNVGTPVQVSVTQPTGPKSLQFQGTWTAPATLLADMHCTYTVTSAASGLGTVVTIRFAGSDPCVGQPDGTVCSDGNACTSGDACHGGVCTPATTVTCSASDSCHVAGVCDPNTGVCSNPNAGDGTSCNADSSGCTVGDSCQAGVCTAGAGAVCNTPPGQCFNATGTCNSTGNTSFTCAYGPKGAGAACSDGDLCTQTDTCNGTGVCVGSNPVNCAGGQCTTGGTCNPATGACQGGTNQPNGTPCTDSNACTTGDSCQGGVCVGTALCPAGSTCNPTGPVCVDTAIVPQVAKLLELSTSVGLGMDTAGNSYVTGTLVTPAKIFDGTTLTSAGAGDVFVGSYDASGVKRWVFNFGDASDQQPTNLAVSDVPSNRVLANGRFSGLVGSLNAGAATWDYLLFLNATTGAIANARAVDTGINGAFLAVGSNPNLGLFAVCGLADQLAMDTTAGAPGTTWATVAGANTFGGATDIVLGVYNAGTGALLWAKQIGTANDEECDAITIDDVGNVLAAGKYSGPASTLTLAGATPLPSPGTANQQHLWVAKFDGTTGAGISQRSYGAGAGQHQVNGIVLDASGNVFIAGVFTNRLPFSATTGSTACVTGSNGCLASVGGQDGFVAKLDSSLAPIWMTRVGVSTGDDVIRGLAVDSFGNPSVAGLLNGASSVQTITPTTAATAAVTSPSITSAGASASSFVMKLPGTNGIFNAATAKTTGNSLTSNSNRIAINAKGTGAVKDAVSFSGEFAGGSLNFGGSSSAITAPSGAATFLVFAKEQ